MQDTNRAYFVISIRSGLKHVDFTEVNCPKEAINGHPSLAFLTQFRSRNKFLNSTLLLFSDRWPWLLQTWARCDVVVKLLWLCLAEDRIRARFARRGIQDFVASHKLCHCNLSRASRNVSFCHYAHTAFLIIFFSFFFSSQIASNQKYLIANCSGGNTGLLYQPSSSTVESQNRIIEA